MCEEGGGGGGILALVFSCNTVAFNLNYMQWNPVNMDIYGPNKAGRNNGVAIIWGHCGVIVNVQQKRLNDH